MSRSRVGWARRTPPVHVKCARRRAHAGCRDDPRGWATPLRGFCPPYNWNYNRSKYLGRTHIHAQPAPGRVVLLTGAAGGIGTAITRALLAAGHSVAAVDRDRAGLEKLAALAAGQAADPRFHAIVAELESASACRQAVEAAAGRFGRVEGVINNAGIGVSSIRDDAEARPPGLEEIDAEIFDRFFAINVRAPMLVTRAAVPLMKARGW